MLGYELAVQLERQALRPVGLVKDEVGLLAGQLPERGGQGGQLAVPGGHPCAGDAGGLEGGTQRARVRRHAQPVAHRRGEGQDVGGRGQQHVRVPAAGGKPRERRGLAARADDGDALGRVHRGLLSG